MMDYGNKESFKDTMRDTVDDVEFLRAELNRQIHENKWVHEDLQDSLIELETIVTKSNTEKNDVICKALVLLLSEITSIKEMLNTALEQNLK